MRKGASPTLGALELPIPVGMSGEGSRCLPPGNARDYDSGEEKNSKSQNDIALRKLRLY